jgi:TolB-like protein
MSLFEELKRRNVFRVAVAYLLLGWAVLQGADFLLDLAEAPGWVIRVFAIAGLVGFPFAIFFAWAYELTPEGIKREAEVDRSQSVASHTGRKLNGVIVGLLVVAVALLAVDRLWRPGGHEKPAATAAAAQESAGSTAAALVPAARDRSIAVLPLANRSSRDEDAYFAEGMHDELLTQLSRVGSLRVISRTSVMGYAGTSKRLPEIGRELGVATLLEGGVQRSGDRVRINVQLIDAQTDEHLWAEVYDRELTADNLFDIQSDITRAIAGALQAVLTGDEQRAVGEKLTSNVEAYAHFLRARAAAVNYGRELAQIDDSIASYQRAIKLDPGFAAAHAALSIDWSERGWTSPLPTDEVENARLALEAAQRLAPDAAETWNAAGYYAYWGHKDYATAIAAFDQALAAEAGNTMALRGRAYTLRRAGRLDEAIASFRKALELDPLNAQMRVDLAYTLMHSGRVVEALDDVANAKAVGETSSFGSGVEAQVSLMLQRLDDAWDALALLQSVQGNYWGNAYLDVVRLSRDPERLAALLRYLADESTILDYPEKPALYRLALLREREDPEHWAGELSRIESRLLAIESLEANREPLLLGFAMTYALMGDRARLDATLAEYYRIRRPDALAPIEDEREVVLALALAGDYAAALDRIERAVSEFGPWEFSVYALDPWFDPVRDEPRFQALDGQYRRWLEAQLQ